MARIDRGQLAHNRSIASQVRCLHSLCVSRVHTHHTAASDMGVSGDSFVGTAASTGALGMLAVLAVAANATTS
jgi:hypothetical protein